MFEGIKNMFVGEKSEKPKNEVEEVSTEETTDEEQVEEIMDKREIGLSQETKEQLSARRTLNLDGTVHVLADEKEKFGNDQERAA